MLTGAVQLHDLCGHQQEASTEILIHLPVSSQAVLKGCVIIVCLGRTLETQVRESWVLHAPTLCHLPLGKPYPETTFTGQCKAHGPHVPSAPSLHPGLLSWFNFGKMITIATVMSLLQARKSRREWVNSSSEYREEDREEEANRNPRDSHQSFRHGVGPGTRPAEHEGPSIWLREEMALNGWHLRQEKAQLSVLAEIRGFSGNLSHLGPTFWKHGELKAAHPRGNANTSFQPGDPESPHFLLESSAPGSHHSWKGSRHPHSCPVSVLVTGLSLSAHLAFVSFGMFQHPVSPCAGNLNIPGWQASCDSASTWFPSGGSWDLNSGPGLNMLTVRWKSLSEPSFPHMPIEGEGKGAQLWGNKLLELQWY